MLGNVIAEVPAFVSLTEEPNPVLVHAAEIRVSSLHMIEDPKVHRESLQPTPSLVSG